MRIYYMGCMLSIMNVVRKCPTNNKKSDLEYFREIFDGLDTEGCLSLNVEELSTIWKLVQDNKMGDLKNELDTYTTKKTMEINITRNQNASVLLENVDTFNLKAFIAIMKKLKLDRDELHKLWISTKQNEIISIKQELNN
jgi:hypothetical protein